MHQRFPRLSSQRYRGGGLSGTKLGAGWWPGCETDGFCGDLWKANFTFSNTKLPFLRWIIQLPNCYRQNPGSWTGWRKTTSVFPSDLIRESFGNIGIVPQLCKIHKSTSPHSPSHWSKHAETSNATDLATSPLFWNELSICCGRARHNFTSLVGEIEVKWSKFKLLDILRSAEWQLTIQSTDELKKATRKWVLSTALRGLHCRKAVDPGKSAALFFAN